MPAELLRRGDLALVRSSTTPHAGLYRGAGGELRPAGALDYEEWRWTHFCAAPLALEQLRPVEPESTGPIPDPPEQAELNLNEEAK